MLGNLTSRADARQDLAENFFYDSLNRVIQTDTITGVSQGGTTQTTTVSYDHRGNITYKSDIGNYTYGTVDPSCTGGGPASPHAVAAITGTKNTVYCYDANGNMTSGDGRAVTYSAFDKPVQITRATSTVTFAYGPDRARYKRIDQTQSATTTTIYAAGGTFEKIASGGTVTEKVYIGDFAVVTNTTTQQGTTNTTNYLHRDHLGSVDTITDQSGVVMQRLSFDTWGKRREVNWQALTPAAIASFDTTLTTRGYTGHEMVDAVGLVHMNGRVYDPEIGKFLSADPHIQDTTNLQNWNRYSYVLNNPLNYTDPSGFFFNKLFKAIGNFFQSVFRAIGNVLKKVLNNPLVRAVIQIIGCANPAAVFTCAPTVAGLTLAAGGSLGDAIKAAAFSFASMGIFNQVGVFVREFGITVANLGAAGAAKGAIHGVVGGALSMAQGGNFLEGFAANAIGAGVGLFSNAISGGNIALDTTIVAAAGCAGAVLSGGKCSNGAITAAFANIYNKMGACANGFSSLMGRCGQILGGGGVGGSGGGGGRTTVSDLFRGFWRNLFGPKTSTHPVIKNGKRGRESEKRVLGDLRLEKNTSKVSTSEGNAIPDALTETLSVEIKDCISVTCTRQIRIQTDAAKASGRESILVTGEHTSVSKAVEERFDQIIRRIDLGPAAK